MTGQALENAARDPRLVGVADIGGSGVAPGRYRDQGKTLRSPTSGSAKPTSGGSGGSSPRGIQRTREDIQKPHVLVGEASIRGVPGGSSPRGNTESTGRHSEAPRLGRRSPYRGVPGGRPPGGPQRTREDRQKLTEHAWARRDLNPHISAISPILCLSTQVGEKSPSWGFHAAMVTGAARLVSSGYTGAVGVHSPPDPPPAPSSDGGPAVLRRAFPALRMSSLWSANSAQTITMITMVRMPVTADTAPCMPVVARLAMVARRPGGRDPGSSAGWPSPLEPEHAVWVRVLPLRSPGMDSRTTE